MDSEYKAAVTEQERGDWDKTRQAWAKVVANSRAFGATVEQRAVYHYEYGRSLGVTCFFAEAEAELLEAYRLDVESNGPVYMSLTELARLSLDQKRYADAARYFERMFSEVDENMLEQSPVEYAKIFGEYADALAAMGSKKEAEAALNEAEAIRREHPQAEPMMERTPYGSQCH